MCQENEAQSKREARDTRNREKRRKNNFFAFPRRACLALLADFSLAFARLKNAKKECLFRRLLRAINPDSYASRVELNVLESFFVLHSRVWHSSKSNICAQIVSTCIKKNTPFSVPRRFCQVLIRNFRSEKRTGAEIVCGIATGDAPVS